MRNWKILLNGEECIVLDVREAAEFAFGHIPSAISVPLGELDSATLDETSKFMLFAELATAVM